MNPIKAARSLTNRLKNRVGIGDAVPGMHSAVDIDAQEFISRFQLESVQAALAKQDPDGAYAALIEHYRYRSTPQWPLFPKRMVDVYTFSLEELCAQANRLVERRFQLAEEPEVQFNTLVDWGYNPTADRRGRWTRELNRHRWMPVLGVAYQMTGDERYANTFVELVCDWIYKNPLPSRKDESNVAWTLMGTGMRCTVWVAAFSVFYESSCFNRESKILMLRSIYDHASFLFRFKTHGNHLLRETNGLAYVAAYFPEFTEADSWKNTVVERVEQELVAQLNSDGSHVEMSIAYQWLVAEELEGTLDLLESIGWSLKRANLYESVERIYEFLAYTCRPDRSWPQLSDGFMEAPQDYVGRLLAAAGRFGREDFFDIATTGIGSAQKECVSVLFPYGGLGIMRSDWTRDANYLLMDTGPFGGVHGHEDKLSIEVCAFGRPYIVDPGTYTYNAQDPYRAYFVSSCAHNTVLVDGMSQVRRWQPVHRSPKAGLREAVEFVSEIAFDFMQASYTDGYGDYCFLPPKKARIVRDISHRRSVLYVKPDYWVVVDEMIATGPHEYCRLFQGASDVSVSINDTGVNMCSEHTGHSLHLLSSNPEGTTLSQIHGSDNPIGGWISDGRRNHKQAATQVRMSSCGSGPVTLMTLIYPRHAATAATNLAIREVSLQDGAGLGICVSSDHGEDWILISDGKHRKSLGVFTTHARIAGFRQPVQGAGDVIFEWS